MALKRIEAWNFKSFHELRLDLAALNVLIGANGAGKSNVLSLLRFIRDAASLGLENAVSLQGGFGYLMNLELGESEPFRLSVAVTPEPEPWWQSIYSYRFPTRLLEVTHVLAIGPGSPPDSLVASEDAVTLNFDVFESKECDATLGKGKAIFRRVSDGRIEQEYQLPNGVTTTDIAGGLGDSVWSMSLEHAASTRSRKPVPGSHPPLSCQERGAARRRRGEVRPQPGTYFRVAVLVRRLRQRGSSDRECVPSYLASSMEVAGWIISAKQVCSTSM